MHRELHKRSPREFATAKGLSKAWSMAEYSFDRWAAVVPLSLAKPVVTVDIWALCCAVFSWWYQIPKCLLKLQQASISPTCDASLLVQAALDQPARQPRLHGDTERLPAPERGEFAAVTCCGFWAGV